MPRTLDVIAKETLGKNLRERREAHEWNQGEAALRIGVTRTRLNLWENGHETPGTEGLVRLAIAYACPVDQLLSGVDEQYDEIIEGRIPIDVQQHYRAKTDAFIRRMTAAMQLAVDAPMLGPTPGETAERQERVIGKSVATRARRKRGK